jgi:type VI secretion system secreted protein VgrG
MASSYQNSRSVKLDGPDALKGARLAHLAGREQISRPFEYQLLLYGSEAAGADGVLDTDRILGQPLTVTFNGVEGGGARHINGIVTEFAYLGYGQRFHEYRAVLRPSLWLLTRRADCRVFQKKSTPDIFVEVCGHAGKINFREALSGRYEPWDYRVQYRETDFDFLSRLLEHEGIFYYFEHSPGKHVMVLTDDVGKLKSVSGYDEVPYYPPSSSSAQRERDHLYSWSFSKSFQPAAFASLEYNFETPGAAARAASAVPNRKDSSKFEIFEYPAGARDLTSAGVEKLAKVRAEQFQAAQSVARSDGDAAGLGTGQLFKLKGYPHADFNKKYLIISSALDVTVDSGPAVGTVREPTRAGPLQFAIAIESVDAAAPFRPERVTSKPLIQGSQTARVVGPSGKEIWTDKYGRVKVQFHWDRVGKSDDSSSCWVRVASTWAGKSWGALHVPRVGQEVVVSFLEGDPDRPLVIGSVFNAEQMPPYDLPGSATRSGLKSRSSLNGTAENSNELRFEDKKGSEEVYLHAEKDMLVEVKNNRVATVKQNDKVDVTKQFTLKAGDQITLECGLAKIVLKKDGTVEISGKEVKVKGTLKASIDATQVAISGTQLDLKGTKTAVQGSGTLDLASSGIASLKGTLTKIG